MKIRLGETEEAREVSLDVNKLFNERLLIQGISGSWKSSLVDVILRNMILRYKQETSKPLQQIIIDWEGERVDKFPNFFSYAVLGKKTEIPLIPENAYSLGTQIRQKGMSVIIDLSSYTDHDEREIVVAEFIDAFLDIDKELWESLNPCVFVIDESHNLCNQSGASKSRSSIIRLAETGRKRKITTILVTQRLAELNKNASAQMANRIIGKTIELADRERAVKMLGLKNDGIKELAELQGGTFFAFGNAISVETVKFKMDKQTENELKGFVESPIKKMEILKDRLLLLPEKSEQRKEEEIKELRSMVKDLANSINQARLAGYSEAMHDVINFINETNKSKIISKIHINFEEKLIDGVKVTVIKK